MCRQGEKERYVHYSPVITQLPSKWLTHRSPARSGYAPSFVNAKYYLCPISQSPQLSMVHYDHNIWRIPDSKVNGAYMGPTWGRQDPGGSHVGPLNLAIRDVIIRTIIFWNSTRECRLDSYAHHT